MATIEIPNVRQESTVLMPTTLKDNGVAVDWSGLQNIKAYMYSDAQRVIAGKCDVEVDGEDATVLKVTYAATRPQYLGVNSLLVRCKYHGREKSYDVPVLNFVERTAQATGVTVLDDPVIDVEIEVDEVSTSLLDSAIAEAFDAAELANAAAEAAEHMVDIKRGPQGKSAYQVAVDNGFEGTEEQWLTSLTGPAGDSAYAIAVQQGFVGTKDQWLASLVGPQGKSAYQVAVDAGFEGTISEWLLSLKGGQGDPGRGITSVVQTTSSNESEGDNVITVTLSDGTTATFIVKNGKRGLQGIPGVANAKYKQVAALPTASAATMDFIYLVESATAGVYNMSYTEEDAGAYSWKSLGTTAIQMDGYAREEKLSQLEAEVDTLVAKMKVLYNALGAGAFWGNKPVIDWGGEDIPVIRNLTNCTCDNTDDSVKIGRSYYAVITPDSGYILGAVTCSMGSTSVSVVNGVIDIDEVTGPITINASGINLDSVAFDGKTYKQIFETNNALGISPGFENGSYSPMTVNAGSPTITTEDADTGIYSLKASGASSQQVKRSSNLSGSGFMACRVKVTEYTTGKCGIQYGDDCGAAAVCDWSTFVNKRTTTLYSIGVYVGSFSSANLTGYVDTPVIVLESVFSTVPTIEQFTQLYETYVAIKKVV